MYKKTIAIFFSILFVGIIITPTVIVALDDSIDTSIFSSLTEEEENSKTKNVISPFSLHHQEIIPNNLSETHKHFTYQFKNYPKPHLNLISPPPELHV